MKPLLSQDSPKHNHSHTPETGHARIYKNGLSLRFRGNDCILELSPEVMTIASKKLRRPYVALKIGRKDGDRFVPTIEPDDQEFTIVCGLVGTNTASVLNKAGSLSQHIDYKPERSHSNRYLKSLALSNKKQKDKRERITKKIKYC